MAMYRSLSAALLFAGLAIGAPVFASAAFAANTVEGKWAAAADLCGKDANLADSNEKFPLLITEQRVDWALNQCTVVQRVGKSGIWQIKASCKSASGETQSDFRLRVRGNQLTVTFADGKRARYVRCN